LKPHILLLGPGITKDEKLLQRLGAKTEITLLQDLGQLGPNTKEQNFVLVIMEISNSWEDVISAIYLLKASIPQAVVIIVNGGGSREAVIRSFRSGASDFFKRPYDANLLAERVEALLEIKVKEQNGRK
jgi:DNA-binding NtrC family response regulator